MLLSSLTMLFAGVGDGIAKIFRDAENGATVAYVIAIVFSMYSIVVAVYLARQWLHRQPDQTVVGLCKIQIGPSLSLAFALWVTFEIARRLLA